MSGNIVLEQYLLELENRLKALGPSERSKIVYETYQHVLESKQKFPEKTIDEILSDLGPADLLANHHLLDKGQRTFRANKHPFLKWITGIFFGSIAFFCLIIGLLIWKFTPVFKIDEKTQRVVILGGLIDVNGISGKIKVGDTYQFVQNKYTNQFNGSMDIPKEEFDELIVNFKSGTIDIRSSLNSTLSWDCQLELPPNKDFVNVGTDIVEIDLEKTGGSSCQIEVPPHLKLTVDGKEGQVTLTEPDNDSFVEIKNGNVALSPNPELDYKYDLKVDNGTIGEFFNSENDSAIEIRVNITNGSILRN